MTHRTLGIIAVAIGSVAIAAPAGAQKLHVSPRWKQCSIQLDPSLSQAAWHQFTIEAAQVVYFRPLVDAQPLGRGNFEVAFMQWQTNVDDKTSAWNDTFVHPDSTHWLYEGSGLQFPGLAFRAGLTSKVDAGAYFTKNVQANYGAYGLQLQHNVISGAQGWNVSGRASYMALFGPEDVQLGVYGADVVTSWKGWRYSRATLVPYAGIAAYLASSHERSSAVTLTDEQVMSAMGTVGASLRFSALRLGAEASISRVPSIAMKLGFGL